MSLKTTFWLPTYSEVINIATSRTYNLLSVTFISASLIMLSLVLRELPNNDNVNGTYIKMLMGLADAGVAEGQQMRALEPLTITEYRVISLLYISTILFSSISIIFGLVGRYRKEGSILHTYSIPVSTMVLVTAYQYKWIFQW